MASKWSVKPVVTGGVLTGLEFISIGDTPTDTYTASTISIDETDNSINDSAASLPIFQVGKLVKLSGATDTAAEINATHTVVSSTASKLVVQTDFTVAEAAGASITVDAVAANYYLTLDELANFINAAGVPNPLSSHTFKDSRHTIVSANVATTTTRNASDGNVHVITLTANTTIDVALGAGQASYMHLIIIPGAFTATLGTSFHKWIGSAPGTIGARHHIMIASVDAGVTNEAKDNGVSA